MPLVLLTRRETEMLDDHIDNSGRREVSVVNAERRPIRKRRCEVAGIKMTVDVRCSCQFSRFRPALTDNPLP